MGKREMRYHTATLWLFALFLIGYFAQKYLAAAPPVYVPGYVTIVAVICVLTALLPFGVSAIVLHRIQNSIVFIPSALAIGVALSACGFATFWFLWISGTPNPPPLTHIMWRGLAPGLFIGSILSVGRLLHRHQT